MPTEQLIKNDRLPISDRYLDLIRAFPLRPLRDDDELRRAVEVIDSLIDKDRLVADEQDYLNVLATLVETYENEHHPLPAVSDADMLRHLIESRDLTQTKLSEATNIAESTISEILSGKRGLNRNHIVALAKFFKLDPGVFISN